MKSSNEDSLCQSSKVIACRPGSSSKTGRPFGRASSRTIRAPNSPLDRCGPVCEWYQKVPDGVASKMYRKFAPGSMGHCVMYPTPSIHGVFFWCIPCQWIEVTWLRKLFVTSTMTLAFSFMINVGPGICLLTVMNERKLRLSTVFGNEQRFGSSHGKPPFSRVGSNSPRLLMKNILPRDFVFS